MQGVGVIKRTSKEKLKQSVNVRLFVVGEKVGGVAEGGVKGRK